MLERRQVIADKIDKLDRNIIRAIEMPVKAEDARSGHWINILLEQLPSEFTGAIANSMVPIPLDPKVLEDVRLVRGTGEARAIVSLAGDGFKYDPPRDLRNISGMEEALKRFAAARDLMIEQLKNGKRPDDASFDAANAALDELDALISNYKRDNKFSSPRDEAYRTYSAAAKFLQEMAKQVTFLSTQSSLPKDFKGNTVQELISYIKSNGLKVEASDKGADNSYKILFDGVQKLFKQLRSTPAPDRPREFLPDKPEKAGFGKPKDGAGGK